jgi:hypothetical protein
MSSMSGDQVKSAFQSANPLDLGIIGAGVLAFFFSLFAFYTVSSNLGSIIGVSGISGFNDSDNRSAWHGFFGWFAVVLALTGAALVVLHLLRARLPVPTRLASLGAFALATVCMLLALLIIPGKLDCNGNSACEKAISYGHGFGYWATFIVILLGLVLCVLRRNARD